MPANKNRTMLLITLLLVAGFAATSLGSYVVSRAALKKEVAQHQLPLTSDNIYSEIQRDLLRPIFISSLMASDTFLRDWVLAGERDPERMVRYLREIQERYGTFTSFFVSEKSRIYYQAKGILKQVRADEERDRWYFRVRDMEPEHEINVDPDMANDDSLTIFINYKVRDYAGNYLGAAGVGLTVSAVKDLVRDYQGRFQRDIYFVDREGRIVLSSSDFSGRGRRLQDIPGLAPLARRILELPQASLEYRRSGRTILLNSRYIPEFDWHLVVEQGEGSALGAIRRALAVNLGLCTLVTFVVLAVTRRSLGAYQREMEELAATDKLTGAYNRRRFETLFGQAMAECRRAGESLSVLLFDLDHFKEVNDCFGHQAGDAALREVCRRIRAALRASDMLFRWGGEEFLLVLRDCPLEDARRIAESLRAQIQAPPLAYREDQISLTASFGIAQLRPEEDQDQLIRRVDQALYLAKARGRNRSETAPAPVLCLPADIEAGQIPGALSLPVTARQV